MIHLSEIDLHIYVVNKSMLAPHTVKEIEQRISNDKKLTEELEEIKEYYQNFEASNIEGEIKVFRLKPRNIDSPEPQKLTLAAQQSATAEPKLQYIKTFLSTEKYVMVRMFHNLISNEYEFYVMCENESSIKNVVIKIQSIDVEIKTDENGIAKISADYIPEDIALTVIME